jgi:flagellar basal body rod protein FlgG
VGKTMQSSYYSVTGAMVTQFNKLDLISNNLANLNTTAFKRDDVVMSAVLITFPISTGSSRRKRVVRPKSFVRTTGRKRN